MLRGIRPLLSAMCVALVLAACVDSPLGTDSEPKPASISITPATVSLTVGDTTQVSGVVLSDRGDTYSPIGGYKLQWSVSDTALAKIYGEGNQVSLIAKAPGSVDLRASYESLSATAPVAIQDLPQLVLSDSALTLENIGDTTAVIQGTIEGSAASNLTIERVQEARWLDDLEVAALSGSRLVAMAPGTAVYRVSAPRSKSADLIVRVQPKAPVIVSFAAPPSAGTGDTLRIRGYLAGLSNESVTVGGQVVNALSRDSANFLFSVTPVSSSTCGVSSRSDVQVTGAKSLVSLSFSRKRSGEVSLAAGEALDLTGDLLNCLRTPAIAGSEYILAFADPTRVEHEKQSTLPYAPVDSFMVSVQDLLPASPSASRSLSVAPSRSTQFDALRVPDFILPSRSAAEGLWNRSSAFTIGETFSFDPFYDSWGSSLNVKVIKIYDDWAVLAVPVDEVSLWDNTPLMASFDSAMAYMLKDGVPYFERVVHPGKPSLGTSNQELLIAKRARDTGNGSGGRAGSWTEYSYGGQTDAERWVSILAHELGHRWHFMERRARVDNGFGWGGWSKWHVEGLAQYLQGETLRRYRNLPLLEQLPLSFFHGDPAYNQFSHGNGKYFIGGYQPVSSFLRDLTQRLITDHGLTQENAVRVIVKGSASGWYGCDSPSDCRSEGLAEIMLRHAGPDWDPVDAMLTWVLAQKGDDIVSNPKYQNLTWKGVGQETYIPEVATVSAASGATGTGYVFVSAASFLVLKDDAVGGAFRISSDNSKLRWRLMRLR